MHRRSPSSANGKVRNISARDDALLEVRRTTKRPERYVPAKIVLVGAAGLEPASLAAADFKSAASANFATPTDLACIVYHRAPENARGIVIGLFYTNCI